MLPPAPLLLPLLLALGDTVPRPPADTAAAAVACDSAALRTPVGAVLDTLFLTLRPANGTNTPPPSPWAALALQGVAEHLTLPRPVALPVWLSVRARGAAKPSAAPDTLRATVSNAVFALVTAGGRLDGAPILAASALDARADSAVLRAVRAADSAGVFAGPPLKAGQGFAVYLGLGTRDRDLDVIPPRAEEAPAYATAAGTVAVPVALVRRDLLVAGTRSAAVGAPDRAFVDSVVGTVPHTNSSALIDFVVDASGAVVPGTILMSRFSRPTYGRAAADLLARQRHTPARVAGCGVPTLERQSRALRVRYGPEWLVSPY